MASRSAEQTTVPPPRPAGGVAAVTAARLGRLREVQGRLEDAAAYYRVCCYGLQVELTFQADDTGDPDTASSSFMTGITVAPVPFF